jgi:quinol monooxygenase YgiN
MSVGVIVEYHFRPGTPGATQLTEEMKKRLPSVTRKADRCKSIYLYVDQEDVNHLVLVERGRARADYDKYLEWAMAQGSTTALMESVATDPKWTYLDDTGA